MPQALAVGGAIAGLAIGGATGAIVTLASSVGAAVWQRHEAKKDAQADNISDNGYQLNTRSSSVPLPLIFGTCKVGVNVTYINSSGSNRRYLHIIGEIGEGQIHGIKTVNGIQQVFLDDKIYTSYRGVHWEFFNGTSDQSACSTLCNAVGEWTTNDRLPYTSYIYVRLTYDQEQFTSCPDITLIVEGLEIYNPITEVTEFTANPALCAYEYMTRSAQRGGIGISSGRLDCGATSTLKTAIDYCDAKGWTCNMPISNNQAVADNLDLILNNYRGDIVPCGSMFYFKFRDLNYESVAMALTTDDIVFDGEKSSLSVSAGTSAGERPNAVNMSYINSAYKTDEYIKSDYTAYATEGDYREQSISVYGLSKDKAQAMANYWLERLRWNKTVTLTARDRCFSLEPMDIITFTDADCGWDTKYFRVLSNRISIQEHICQLVLVEEKLELYDDTYDMSSDSWYDTTLPNPNDPVPSVANVSHSEEVYYYRGQSFTRWKIDFDPPDITVYPWWDYAEVWVKIGEEGTWRYMTRSESDYMIDPVEEGQTYFCKLRSVSLWGKAENFDNAYVASKTIIGKTDLPSNLTGMVAIANGDTLRIFANPVTDPDNDGYEVRLGSAWAGGLFISYNKHCSLTLSGVRPGTHTFWMSPVRLGIDGTRVYSETPVSATVTVFVPPGYAELATYGSWAWDFNSGTHSNTEHTIYDTEDALICSHGGTSGVITDGDDDITDGTDPITDGGSVGGEGGLSGTFTSPTHDLGAVEMVRVWGDFRTAFLSGDTTFAGVAPITVDETIDNAAAVDKGGGLVGIPITGHGFTSANKIEISGSTNYDGYWPIESVSTDEIVIATTYVAETFTGDEVARDGITWEDLGAATRSFAEIFQPSQAGQLQAALQYKELSDGDWNDISFFEIQCAEISARYVRVKITITDPTADSQTYLRELNMLAYTGPQA